MKTRAFFPVLSVVLVASLLPTLQMSCHAAGILYYPRTDGAVVGLNVPAGTQAILVPASSFAGANPGAGRETAFDPETRLLWYTATDNQIHSVHVDVLTAGPGITNVPGAIIGGSRHVFIDYTRRKLLVPITDGSIQMYDLANQQTNGSIPATFFTDGNVGAFRHFAADQRAGTLWYAATDGWFREMNPDTMNHTGRIISFSAQTGANPGAFRHLVVDPMLNLLLYAVTDGSVASIDLTTLQAGTLTMSSGAFDTVDPGAGRIITYDVQFLKVSMVVGPPGQCSLTWRSLGTNYGYTVEYRDALNSGNWTPVPPTNQWPTTLTSLSNQPLSGLSRFYRVVAQPQ
ncbi:MAG: hypothetical protein HY298_06855 [Verrucomicrobia bacterium]|nr:hypothetical protein [Verrucomicrobiota bacterium]